GAGGDAGRRRDGGAGWPGPGTGPRCAGAPAAARLRRARLRLPVPPDPARDGHLRQPGRPRHLPAAGGDRPLVPRPRQRRPDARGVPDVADGRGDRRPGRDGARAAGRLGSEPLHLPLQARGAGAVLPADAGARRGRRHLAGDLVQPDRTGERVLDDRDRPRRPRPALHPDPDPDQLLRVRPSARGGVPRPGRRRVVDLPPGHPAPGDARGDRRCPAGVHALVRRVRADLLRRRRRRPDPAARDLLPDPLRALAGHQRRGRGGDRGLGPRSALRSARRLGAGPQAGL
ncbi:MAG: Spermidine Putrescine ABC transporter permease component potC (TC_3.A.1.11.1), partial [uncultured Thermomicrobiales bacterium]